MKIEELSENAVRQSVKRLVANGFLERYDNGIYYIPRQEDYIMARVVKFLKEAEIYYLATVEGNQPRVRPFGTARIFEDKLYIQLDAYPSLQKMYSADVGNTEVFYFKNGLLLALFFKNS